MNGPLPLETCEEQSEMRDITKEKNEFYELKRNVFQTLDASYVLTEVAQGFPKQLADGNMILGINYFIGYNHYGKLNLCCSFPHKLKMQRRSNSSGNNTTYQQLQGRM